MNLNEIRETLAARQIQLTKSLGQNFLHDANHLRRIVEVAELSSGDYVLEIGPGLGALTQHLLPAVGQLLCLEKDQRLCDFLRKRFGHEPKLQLIHADALEYVRQHREWSNWKMVSNLPYSVGSPIMVELAKAPAAPERMVVTVQHEVAQRLAGGPGESDYGVLTLLVQLRFEVVDMFKIPASCFYPIPEVESACVTLRRRPASLLEPESFRAFEKLVKRGFSQRRKMMMKLLKADWSLTRLEAAFSELGISKQARAETVSLAQFVEMTKLLTAPE